MASLINRNGNYYIQWCVGGKANRRSLGTTNAKIAEEHLRQYESSETRGLPSPLPSRTPIGDIVGRYVNHIRATKKAKSAQGNVYYLRDMFGPICNELKNTARVVTSAKPKVKTKKKAANNGTDPVIEAGAFEEISTAKLAQFISQRVQSCEKRVTVLTKGKPSSANSATCRPRRRLRNAVSRRSSASTRACIAASAG